MISYFYSTHLCLYKIINKLLKPIEAHICEEDNPCLNGGVCIPVYESKAYVCNCSKYFYGDTCQKCKKNFSISILCTKIVSSEQPARLSNCFS